ncbi:hypothetical protein RJT34_03008 [Clitoria ternatea]|uniref:Uncharacterized protein n=1 Tax=Clitoria ternatea TaxID=43366 RepID=A0AAN9KM54_CLITE
MLYSRTPYVHIMDTNYAFVIFGEMGNGIGFPITEILKVQVPFVILGHDAILWKLALAFGSIFGKPLHLKRYVRFFLWLLCCNALPSNAKRRHCGDGLGSLSLVDLSLGVSGYQLAHEFDKFGDWHSPLEATLKLNVDRSCHDLNTKWEQERRDMHGIKG